MTTALLVYLASGLAFTAGLIVGWWARADSDPSTNQPRSTA